MYDWFPLVFFPFKIIVLGTGMFFAIKWHHDQAKKERAKKNNETSRPKVSAEHTLEPRSRPRISKPCYYGWTGPRRGST